MNRVNGKESLESKRNKKKGTRGVNMTMRRITAEFIQRFSFARPTDWTYAEENVLRWRETKGRVV